MADPRGSATVCDRSKSRFRRYSCVHGFGHAFMRIYEEHLARALRLCAALGDPSTADCAQGVY